MNPPLPPHINRAALLPRQMRHTLPHDPRRLARDLIPARRLARVGPRRHHAYAHEAAAGVEGAGELEGAAEWGGVAAEVGDQVCTSVDVEVPAGDLGRGHVGDGADAFLGVERAAAGGAVVVAGWWGALEEGVRGGWDGERGGGREGGEEEEGEWGEEHCEDEHCEGGAGRVRAVGCGGVRTRGWRWRC